MAVLNLSVANQKSYMEPEEGVAEGALLQFIAGMVDEGVIIMAAMKSQWAINLTIDERIKALAHWFNDPLASRYMQDMSSGGPNVDCSVLRTSTIRRFINLSYQAHDLSFRPKKGSISAMLSNQKKFGCWHLGWEFVGVDPYGSREHLWTPNLK